MLYEKGERYDFAVGHQEGCYIDMSDSGMSILLYFDHPTEEEIKEVMAGNSLEIRMLPMKESMIFLIKFGVMAWMDAPYSPHLSKNFSGMQPLDGKGIATTITLFDTRTGELKEIRLLSLSNSFSQLIAKNIEEYKKKEFDAKEYYTYISKLFSAYTTKDFVKMSTQGFKISSHTSSQEG